MKVVIATNGSGPIGRSRLKLLVLLKGKLDRMKYKCLKLKMKILDSYELFWRLCLDSMLSHWTLRSKESDSLDSSKHSRYASMEKVECRYHPCSKERRLIQFNSSPYCFLDLEPEIQIQAKV